MHAHIHTQACIQRNTHTCAHMHTRTHMCAHAHTQIYPQMLHTSIDDHVFYNKIILIYKFVKNLGTITLLAQFWID